MSPSFSQNALTIIEKRYLLRDPETGLPLEDAEGMLRRVANYIAEAELPEDRVEMARLFYNMMASLEFLPNTPCLVNAGKGLKDSGLSACFVLPIEDDLDKIYKTLADAATVIKSGGGVGYSFSKLRPSGDRVATTGGVAGGPVAFMKLFHNSAQSVKQGGVRPAAQMAILRVDHPDILEFISSKEKDKALNTFNISVGITSDFMKAVALDNDFELVNPRTRTVHSVVKAREIWASIIDFAWRTGDPGLFFLDTANKQNPTPEFGPYEATNPCGEVVLLPGEPCNLGSLVLTKFLRPDYEKYLSGLEDLAGFNDVIDYGRLEAAAALATRFLDDVITMNAYPVELVKEMALGNRKIGLGVMGWADLLIKLRVPYGSKIAEALAMSMMRAIKNSSYDESERLAYTRGDFPNWAKSELAKDTAVWGPARHQRNSTKLTIAPTGSISILADCSSGIEPHFALAYTRKAINNTQTLHFFNEDLKPWLEKLFDEDELTEIAAELSQVGSLSRLSQHWVEKIRKERPELFGIFSVSYDIPAADHIKTQAAFQIYVDSSISKTINMPKSATREDIARAYEMAWTLGCKGITVYRDGCRSDQVLAIGESRAADDKTSVVEKPIMVGPRPRQHAMRGSTRMIPTGCGPLVVTINEDEQGIAEVIVKGGKSGGCIAAQVEAIGRLASLCMRSGVPKEKVISQLGGITCHLPTFYPEQPQGRNRVLSCADAISVALVEAVYESEHKVIEVKKSSMGHQGSCPECQGQVVNDSGCVKCISPSCGWSKC